MNENEMKERRRPRGGYAIAVGTYSSGEQVVSVMDDEGRSRSLSPDDADRLADQLREAAALVRAGRGRERERRWKIGGEGKGREGVIREASTMKIPGL